MPYELTQTELRRYALLGAEARLLSITEEAAAIRRTFPELRNGSRTHGEAEGASQNGDRGRGAQTQRKSGRKTGGMSAAQRNAVGEGMRRYWAERRATTQQDANQAPKNTEEAAPAPYVRQKRGGRKRQGRNRA